MIRFTVYVILIFSTHLLFSGLSCDDENDEIELLKGEGDTENSEGDTENVGGDTESVGGDTESDTDTHSETEVDTACASNANSILSISNPTIYNHKSDPCECGANTAVECVDLSGEVIDKGSDKPASDIQVTALCNATGDPIPNVNTMVTGAQGKFTLENVPRGRIGLLFEDVNMGDRSCRYDTTWHWGVNTETNRSKFYVIGGAISSMMYTETGCSSADEDGNALLLLSGAAYSMDQASGELFPLTCGTISVDPVTSQTDIWYKNDSGLPDRTLQTTNPRNGSYMVCGILPGQEYTIKLSVDGRVVAQDSFYARSLENQMNSQILYLVAETSAPGGNS